MSREMQVWLESPASIDGAIELAAAIEPAAGGRRRLWYRIPERCRSMLPGEDDGDPFVLGLVFDAMMERSNLVIHATVSSSLLENLEEFIAIWASWKPKRYGRISVRAQREAEVPRAAGGLAAFSGGVDGAYSIHRHRRGAAGRRQVDVSMALFVHGFDIPIDSAGPFAGPFASAERKAKAMVESLGVGLIPVATNLRRQGLDWEESHGAALASCLTLFKGGFGTGLVGPTWPYPIPRIAWGSNPLTDPLLSSDSFRIVHDEASTSRLGRVREIAEWPEALAHLRVCWLDGYYDRNCCDCPKCIRTILAFLALGKPRPPAFERMPSDGRIRSMRLSGPAYLALIVEILSTARENGFGQEGWCRALAACVRRNRLRFLWRDLRSGLKAVFGHGAT